MENMILFIFDYESTRKK